jgi:predicted GTPase
MALDPDLQVQSISAGLQKLQQLLDNPVATSALELSKNASAAREYDVLKRLHKSLHQYVQRNGTLFYVGVLGHFSAGKSSTINSLLDTWKTNDERATDLNPTDNTITLITRERNGPSLLGVIKEGHVTIRLEPVESDLLDEIVLVDTPGTGDPQFVEEVARDFLPICDLILFLFSAASPFDKSDAPLLLELHKRLPFIPIHFVVTRTDELRTDSCVPLTEQNLDSRKTEQFLSTVVARVNTLLSPQVYAATSFSLIDNKSRFRVEQLKAFLGARCNSSNPEAHIAMHLNKLHFYRSGSKFLRIFFSTILEKKLEELTRIVEAATKNIDRYHRLVQISNSNLTKTWMEHSATINAAATRALETVRLLDALPQVYTGFRSVGTKRNILSSDLARSAKHHAGSIGSSLKAKVNGMLQEHLYEVQKQIAVTSLQELSADVHGNVEGLKVQVSALTEMQAPVSLNHLGSELRDVEAESLRDAAAFVRRSLMTLHEQVGQQAPLCLAAECIQGATESLKTDLNHFFQNVELYRSGVFSHATKESIATLGIGSKLDALETEFTDADKEEFTFSASADLFPGAQDLIDSATTRAAQLSQRALGVIEEARSVRIEQPEDNLAAVHQIVVSEREALAEELKAGLQNEIDQFCSGISVTLASLIVQAKSQCDSDLRVLSRARLKRYSFAFALTGILFACASFAYHHSGQPGPTTFAGEALLNLGCGALLEVVVLGILKIRENAPKLLARTREQVHVKLQDDIKQTIEMQLKGLTLNSLNEQVLTVKVARIYEHALNLPSAAWRTRAGESLDSIRTLFVKYADLRSTFAAIVQTVRQEALQYFIDSSRNLSVLNQVAGRIKAKAIEPSFELLEATRIELLSVKTEVEAITFD